MWVKATVMKLRMAILHMNNLCKQSLVATLMLVLSAVSSLALAHGTDIKLKVVNSNQLEVLAQFDANEPMVNAQILIYAANKPESVWQQGTADEKGWFIADIDTSIEGIWALSIRTAGHGELRHFEVRNSQINLSKSEQRPFWQTLLMVLFVFAALALVAKLAKRPKAQSPIANNINDNAKNSKNAE